MEKNKIYNRGVKYINPNAKIGFVVWFPFQFFVYKSVYKHLSDKAEFIVDLGVAFPNKQKDEDVEKIINLLIKHDVKFRILHHEDYYHEQFLNIFFGKYTALVGTWMKACLKLKATESIKKIHMTYGAGKELTTFGLWKKDFDLILAYGNFDQKFYSTITNSIIIGNPKFDDWFSGSFDDLLMKELQAQLDPKKSTVLYLPTHSDLSSIRDLSAELKHLATDYNIIVKVHYLTVVDEPELLDELIDENIILFNDDVDLLTLLYVSDMVLSDNSSAIFDAILVDKPVLVTNFHSEEYFENEHRTLKVNNRGLAGALTYSGSIEQRIKRNGTICVINKTKDLKKGIEITLEDKVDTREKRRSLCRELFGFFDNASGKRGAEAIEDFLRHSSIKEQEKPFLYHAIKDYESKVLYTYLDKLKNKEQTQSIVEENFGVESSDIMVIDTDLVSNEDKTLSISSVFLNAALIKSKVSIFIFTKNIEQIEECVKKLTVPLVSYQVITIGKLGKSVKRAIETSSSDFICFTTTSCIVQDKWLFNLFLGYSLSPDIVATGGYVEKIKKRFTIYDEYNFFLLARKLGLHMGVQGYIKNLYGVKNSVVTQNPFGDIKNISYRRRVFTRDGFSWDKISNLETLETYFRFRALAAGNVLFQPHHVIDLEEVQSKKFNNKNFALGAAHYYMTLFYRDFLQYYNNPGMKALNDVFANLFIGYQKIQLTRVILMAGLFYSLGYYYTKINLWAISLKTKYRK